MYIIWCECFLIRKTAQKWAFFFRNPVKSKIKTFLWLGRKKNRNPQNWFFANAYHTSIPLVPIIWNSLFFSICHVGSRGTETYLDINSSSSWLQGDKDIDGEFICQGESLFICISISQIIKFTEHFRWYILRWVGQHQIIILDLRFGSLCLWSSKNISFIIQRSIMVESSSNWGDFQVKMVNIYKWLVLGQPPLSLNKELDQEMKRVCSNQRSRLFFFSTWLIELEVTLSSKYEVSKHLLVQRRVSLVSMSLPLIAGGTS